MRESFSVAEPVEAPDIDRVINSIRALRQAQWPNWGWVDSMKRHRDWAEIHFCVWRALRKCVKKRSGHRIFSEEKQKCREERRIWMKRRNIIADSVMRCDFEPRTHDRASLLSTFDLRLWTFDYWQATSNKQQEILLTKQKEFDDIKKIIK